MPLGETTTPHRPTYQDHARPRSPRVCEVERQPAFTSIRVAVEGCRQAALRRLGTAARPSLGVNADDVCAIVREYSASSWSRHHPHEVEDLEPLKGLPCPTVSAGIGTEGVLGASDSIWAVCSPIVGGWGRGFCGVSENIAIRPGNRTSRSPI